MNRPDPEEESNSLVEDLTDVGRSIFEPGYADRRAEEDQEEDEDSEE